MRIRTEVWLAVMQPELAFSGGSLQRAASAMKMRRLLLTWLIAVHTIVSVEAQGTFQNLNFEAVNISPPEQRGFFPFSEVFPGWVGYIGTNQATQAFYTGVSLGSALSSLIGPYTSFYSNYVISGSYTAVLAAGEINPGPNASVVSAAIAQSSLVPLSAQSLRFSVGSLSRVSDLRVTFDGQDIPIFPLSAGPNFDVYGGNISACAGLTGELRFTSQPISSPLSKAYLDNIFFSPEAIPEPGMFALIGLGALLLGWRLRKS